MKEVNYWKQFMTTGSVEDFLAYKNVAREKETRGEQEKRSGEQSHAGLDRDHGNGFKG